MHKHLLAGTTLALLVAKFATAAPVEFGGAGAQPADIQTPVTAFRTALGPNNGVGGTFSGGRREINWDAIPDAFSAPHLMPANFFNANSKRGAVFFTPGTGFKVSAKVGNPTVTPVEFGEIAPNLPHEFQTFSPPRLFTALDSAITEVLFFIPGTNIPATVTAFGSVFTNVAHAGTTKIEYFDVRGAVLHTQFVAPGTVQHESLSFAGTAFDAGEQVYLVRITSGNVELGADGGAFPNNRRGEPVDLVVMDDFIYAEPQALELQ
jgi:hypothetical protein